MYFLYGVVCLCFAALLFAKTLLGTRNPVRPFWAGESIVANVLTPAILGFIVLGIGACSKAFMADVLPGLLELGCAAISAVVTVGIVRMMGIRKKLAAFSAEETKRGEVIHFDFQANLPPETPINDKPDFRKAA
jgi:hypothetical protein